MHDGLCHSLPPLRPSVRPPHRVLVSSGDRWIFLMLALPIIVLREVAVSGELLFSFGLGSEGCGSQK